MSKWWGGDTVGEDDVGSHGMVASLKLSLVHCHFYGHRNCAPKEGKMKNNPAGASHSDARHNIIDVVL
jgi:hypothetical protein